MEEGSLCAQRGEIWATATLHTGMGKLHFCERLMQAETYKPELSPEGRMKSHLAAEGGDVPPGKEAQASGVVPTPASPPAAWRQSFQHPLEVVCLQKNWELGFRRETRSLCHAKHRKGVLQVWAVLRENHPLLLLPVPPHLSPVADRECGYLQPEEAASTSALNLGTAGPVTHQLSLGSGTAC